MDISTWCRSELERDRKRRETLASELRLLEQHLHDFHLIWNDERGRALFTRYINPITIRARDIIQELSKQAHHLETAYKEFVHLESLHHQLMEASRRTHEEIRHSSHAAQVSRAHADAASIHISDAQTSISEAESLLSSL